jgi:VanZ family protein
VPVYTDCRSRWYNRRSLRRIFLITVLLIVYGSLYPFDFHAKEAGPGPLWMLFHSWPHEFIRYLIRDGALNVLIYIPIGLFGNLWIRQRKTALMAACLTLLFAAALSATMEMTQLFDGSRECSAGDFVTNVAGAALGIFLAEVSGKTVARTVAGVEAGRKLRPSDALLLLGCWVGYQVYPAIPHVGIWQLRAGLQSLGPPWPVSAVQTFASVIDWLVVARLLEAIDAVRFWPVLMLLLPARLLIIQRSLTWPEVIGVILAWVLWKAWVAGYKHRTMLLAWSATAMLLLRGLRPFTWQSSATHFSWMPFASFLAQDQTQGAIVFLNKAFLYGTALWLLRQAGYSLLLATAGVAILLGAIEAIQIHLPGRTAEITDPVLAIILALVLKNLAAPTRS